MEREREIERSRDQKEDIHGQRIGRDGRQTRRRIKIRIKTRRDGHRENRDMRDEKRYR